MLCDHFKQGNLTYLIILCISQIYDVNAFQTEILPAFYWQIQTQVLYGSYQ